MVMQTLWQFAEQSGLFTDSFRDGHGDVPPVADIPRESLPFPHPGRKLTREETQDNRVNAPKMLIVVIARGAKQSRASCAIHRLGTSIAIAASPRFAMTGQPDSPPVTRLRGE
jgi:hypothetical protein